MNIGDVVRLNSGGELLTIAGIYHDKSDNTEWVSVVWQVEGFSDMSMAELPEACVYLVGER